MPGKPWSKSPQEWQDLITSLLRIRYAIGDFVTIPDKVHGDYGIEGFARDGRVFQCYAAQEPLSTNELTKKQKTKINNDLDKLCDNSTQLKILFGETMIKRWVLVVPRWEDKALHEHAETRAADLRKKSLPFITNDFSPAITTLEDFTVEYQKLIGTGKERLKIKTSKIDESELEDWVKDDKNNDLMINLDRKTLAICQGQEVHAKQLRNEFVRHHLEGGRALEQLHSDFPDLYEKAFQVKEEYAQFLIMESLLCDSLPKQNLKETKAKLEEEFLQAFPGMSPHTIKQLVHEAITDWLLRCPLDFPQILSSNECAS